MKNKKLGAVLSGGGSYGSFSVGTLTKLDKDYDVIVGISTGALMSPLVGLKEWDILKEGYTSVTQNSIFDNPWYRPAPFKKNGNINVLSVLYSLLMGKPTLGTTNALRKLINQFVNEEHYNRLIELKKEIVVGAQNLRQSPSKVHYFNIQDYDFESFKDWMWASANAPFFSSLLNKKWQDSLFIYREFMGQWTDGGLTEFIALNEAFDRGCTDIDVFIHRTMPEEIYEIPPVKNLIENITRSTNAMRYDIEFEFLLERAEYFATNKNINVTLYFLSRKLGNNSLIFNKEKMLQWWKEGYDLAYDDKRIIKFKTK